MVSLMPGISECLQLCSHIFSHNVTSAVSHPPGVQKYKNKAKGAPPTPPPLNMPLITSASHHISHSLIPGIGFKKIHVSNSSSGVDNGAGPDARGVQLTVVVLLSVWRLDHGSRDVVSGGRAPRAFARALSTNERQCEEGQKRVNNESLIRRICRRRRGESRGTCDVPYVKGVWRGFNLPSPICFRGQPPISR